MIQLKNINKSYGELNVVRNLSLTIPENKITVLIGPSGCGKTTILEMINGLVKPDGGQIWVNGKDIEGTDLIHLRRRIGYVIQEIGLFPHYTIFDNIALVPRLLKWEETRISVQVIKMMNLVNLPTERLKKFPCQLSGGEQQRVGIARALAGDPEYLLMDEPFSGIDPVNRGNLQKEFLDIQTKIKKTIVVVTHDMDEAIKLGDYIAVFNQGRLVQLETPFNLLQKPVDDFVRIFLGKERYLKTLGIIKVVEIINESSRIFPAAFEDINTDTAHKIMAKFNTPYLFLIDGDGRFVGYITKKYLAASQEPGLNVLNDLVPVNQASNLRTALDKILTSPIPAIPVVDQDGILVAKLTIQDFLQFSARSFAPPIRGR